MKKNDALNRIFENLKNGDVYGKYRYWDYYHNEPFTYPYFDEVLYKTCYGNIGCTHYGSCACKFTLKELKWIIEVIFQRTAEQFEKEYMLESVFESLPQSEILKMQAQKC